MRLVDDDRVVVLQLAVAAEGGKEDAVGHEGDARVAAHLVGEAHLVADEAAELGTELFGDALGDGARGDAARLGVGDAHSVQLEQNLGQLRRLARPGLARDDDDLVVANGGGDVVAPLRHRQISRVVDARHGAARGRSHEPFSLRLRRSTPPAL